MLARNPSTSWRQPQNGRELSSSRWLRSAAFCAGLLFSSASQAATYIFEGTVDHITPVGPAAGALINDMGVHVGSAVKISFDLNPTAQKFYFESNSAGLSIDGQDQEGFGSFAQMEFGANYTIIQPRASLVKRYGSANRERAISINTILELPCLRDFSTRNNCYFDESQLTPSSVAGISFNVFDYIYPGSDLSQFVASVKFSRATVIGTPLNLSVPEPSVWALMIGGFGAVGAVGRRKTRRGRMLEA